MIEQYLLSNAVIYFTLVMFNNHLNGRIYQTFRSTMWLFLPFLLWGYFTLGSVPVYLLWLIWK